MNRQTTLQARRFLAKEWAVFIVLFAVSGAFAGCAPTTAAPANTLTIGIVNASPAREVVVDAFKTELARLGYKEGQRVNFVYKGATADAAERTAWATELVAQKVDLILAVTTPGAQSAAAATTSIPIVFVPVTDPIGAKLVASLQAPGGNITGVTNGNPHSLRLRLLHDIKPSIKRVYVPINSDSSPSRSAMDGVRLVARELGIELVEQDLRSDEEISAAMAAIPTNIDAIFITPDPRIASFSQKWVDAANALGVPVSSLSATEVENGVLMSYGEDLGLAAAQAARMAETILNGTSPATMPVETTEYFLSLNLTTAQTIHLRVPDDVIRRAKLVIRP